MFKKQIKINNINLTYYQKGKGETILFFHGGRLRALPFIKIFKKIYNNYEVIIPDIPGFGESNLSKQINSFSKYGNFFLKFLKKIKKNNVIVVGYSFGGGIAINMINSPNKIIKKIIIINSSGIINSNQSKLIQDLKRFIFYLTNFRYFKIFFTLIKEWFYFYFNHFKDLKYLTKIRKNENKLNFTKIKKPLIIIWSKNDDIFPLKIAKKIINSLKKPKNILKLFITEGNHDWIFLNQKKFMKILKKALIV
ncbi:MAG: hypothetical protein Fur009_1980 [Candidatus Microgenomates bacterium]